MHPPPRHCSDCQFHVHCEHAGQRHPATEQNQARIVLGGQTPARTVLGGAPDSAGSAAMEDSAVSGGAVGHGEP